jgi:hypothetical protein
MDFYAANIYGTGPVAVPAVSPPASASSTDALGHAGGWKGLVSPKNPLMWIGAIALATMGAAGLAGSVRLGPAKASASLGKS